MGKDRDPGDQTRPMSPNRDPKLQAARVKLPDGKIKDFDLPRGSDGEALFRQVTADLSIEEKEYFSLCFYDKNGERHWLYNDKKILRQLKGLPWEFSFEVKFYPTTPSTLVDDHARFYLYRQLRRDVITGTLPATAESLDMLAAFVAQIEYGDAPSIEMTPEYEAYIANAGLVPSEHAVRENFQKIVAYHRELKGRTSSEVETMFLDHCKSLALYGIHIFPAKDKDNKEVQIGVGAIGIYIFAGDDLQHRFAWPMIIKISYRKNTFTVRLKAGELAKNEANMVYKLQDYPHAKRVWKCAVEHHTFFRLIQPENKPKGTLFSFGSQRFRYHGRTQFQTKMASQMFDRPIAVDRSPSAMSQPVDAGRQVLTPLHYTDTELEQRNIEKYRRSFSPKSYTRYPLADSAFTQYSRPSTLHVTTTTAATSCRTSQQYDESLQYSPYSPSQSGAAYYLSERSSLRTPSSAYYPPSEQASHSSGFQSPTDSVAQYQVNLRSKGAGGNARRNLFGRSSGTSQDTVKLVSFHEPVDPMQPIPNTYPERELPEIPIQRIVQVYHEGHYDRLERRQHEMPAGFGMYSPRNGVTHVENLGPNNEMDAQPIRFYVDVRHSGQSRRNPLKRRSHPGKEDVKEKIDPKDYQFTRPSSNERFHRTELAREVTPANIKQYTHIYHSGYSCSTEPSTSNEPPRYRLITHVNPLVVSHTRDGRSRVSSSNVNATLAQKEQVVSTTTRKESPDSDRRLRLSASVDRSGNLTQDEDEPSTSKDIRSVTKINRIPPSSTSPTSKPYPIFHDYTKREDDLKSMPLVLESRISPKSRRHLTEHGLKATMRSQKHSRIGIGRIPQDGDQDKIEKSNIATEAYSFSTDVYDGQLDEINRQDELAESPITDHAAVYHHGRSWIKDEPVAPSPKEKKTVIHVKSPKKTKVVEPEEPETKEVRLTARVKPDEPEPEPAVEKTPKKKETTMFGFFKSKTTKTTETSTYPVVHEAYTGPLDTTDRSQDLENIPLEHRSSIPAYVPKEYEIYQKAEPIVHEEKRRVRLIARIRHDGKRIRHDGDEDEIEKSNIATGAYSFSTDAYDGPLDEINRQDELAESPITDHAAVYHHGRSWIKDEPVAPSPKEKRAIIHVKSPKKTKVVEPEEPETKEVRLIARVKPDEPEPEPAVEKTPKKKETTKFGFFKSKTTKTTETSTYPVVHEAYTGPLDTTDRSQDLENIPLEHRSSIPAYVPKEYEIYQKAEPIVHEEKRRVRLIARIRHDGDEDEIEKSNIATGAYSFSTDAYDGPLDEINRQDELAESPITDHAAVYHHGRSWIKDEPVAPSPKEKRAIIHVKSPKKTKVVEPEEPETKEVRLIARVKPDEPELEPAVEKTPKKKETTKFGFFKSKTTKTTETSTYPVVHEAYTGPLDTTDRSQDLENIPLEHRSSIPAYVPKEYEIYQKAEPIVHEEKRRVRLIARIRHDGDEDEIEKSNIATGAYSFSTDAYDGPLDEINRQDELAESPITDHAAVYHHGRSWIKDEPVAPSPKEKRAIIHVKSPKKTKVVEPEEPETKEVRLIARVKPDEPEPEPAVEKTPKKKETTKFGFFKSKTTKTTETSTYPVVHEAYTGPLDTTDRSQDLENIPLEHRSSIPAYVPKEYEIYQKAEPIVHEEKRRVRLIARIRHDGDEDEIEKSNIATGAYSFSTDAYDGPLDEINRQDELAESPITDHAAVYHHGRSWIKDEPVAPSPKEKRAIIHVKSPKKTKVVEPEEPETKEVRLIARVKSDEPELEPAVEKTPKKKETSKFGFFKSKITKNTETSTYPVVHEAYTGPLDTTDRSQDLENIPLEHRSSIPAYVPKEYEIYQKAEPIVHEEKRRVRLIARIRHDGDEDEIEKSNIATGAYSFSTDAYDGPLDEINRQDELAESPITDHAAVYHHGRSWIKDEPVAPSPKEKRAIIHVKSPKKTKVVEPEEPETKEVRLIARVKPDEPEPEPAVEKTPKKKETSKFGFFKSKTTKTTKTSTYPVVHEAYTGPLDTTDRSQDLENIPLEHRSSIPAYVPKEYEIYQKAEPIVHEEKRRVRLIARIRHDGDEDEIEKSNIATGAYSFSTDAYDGPLDEINRQDELAESPITDHAAVYHHGRSWIKDEPVAPSPKEKRAIIHVKSPKKTKVVEPEEPETKEVRLIARVKPDEPEPEPAVEKTPKKKETSKFGFFKSKTTKTTETSTYPVVHEAYTGPLDTTDRSQDLENIPLEHRSSIPAYVPKEYEIYQKAEPIVHEEKRRVRLIARIRHDGDEDEIEKSNIATGAYSFSTDAYDGPLDEINRQDELAESPITDHAAVYHHGRSWIKDEPVAPSPKEKRAIIHVKSPKKTKVVEPEEPETKEVRLIARVKPDEPELEPAVEKTPKKKETTKFGFFKSKTTKTTETSTYPVVHEAYTGPLDTTDRSQDLENIPLEHRSSIPAYVPKEYEIYQKAEPIVHEEKRRVRLIARIRHDGDEDEIEKSNIATGAYSFSTDAYDGPLDEINRQDELAESPITDHAAVYHHGRSWIKDEPVAPSPKEKRAIIHVKSPKKTKVVEPEEPETKEVRLIARVKPDEPEPEPAVEKTPKKKETTKFGFFKSKTTKTTETSTYPVVHEAYTGPLDTTDRSQDLENIPLEHRSSIPAYVPKEYEIYQKAEPIVHEEKRRVRLIARIRHDGDEDEIEKSNIATGAYSFSTDAYDGPLDEINRQDELAESPITDHAAVYHHGRSWIKDEPVAPSPKEKRAVIHVKSPKKTKVVEPEEPETKEVRLIARVKPDEPEPEPAVEKTPKKKETSKFGFFKSKTTKTTETSTYPVVHEAYTGPLDTTDRSQDLENIPLEHRSSIPAYVPKEYEIYQKAEPIVHEEKRRVRLIARIRHDGDEDEIEKSNIATGAYSFSTDAYDGPLDEINRQEELAESPITDHAAVYHHGRSWIKDEPVAPSPKEKKTVIHVKSPKKTKVVEPEEPETKEVRLIARVKPDEPEPEPAVEKTPKKKETTKFGFFKSKTTKTTETLTYPVVHEAYTGPLDTTDRSQDLENIPLEHRSSIPAYVPKEYEIYQKAEPIVHEEKRRVRLIARIRHDGDEDEIEKSNIATGAYSFSTDAYDGPLDEINRQDELAESPITDHAAVYHHGRSWIKDEPVAPSPKEKRAIIHVKSPKKTKVVEPEEPETKEVRLIARVKPDEPEPEPAVEKTPKKKETTKFGFFKSKTTKTTETSTYPVVHEAYTGPLDTTDRSQDLENIPLEHRSSIPAYVPKEYEIYQKAEPIVHEEKRRVRLIARIRHDGDEDEIEKSNIATGAYSFSTDAYDGPLDEINRQDELAESPITDHAAVYHLGRSWIKDEPVAPSPKEKRAIIHVKSPKKTKVVEPEEPETKEVRLIARVKPDEPEPEPAVEKTPKKKETTKFGFFKSKTTKTTETSTYPVVHEAYTGPLDTTDRSQDLENIPLEHRSSIPAYVPKEYEIYQKAEPIVHEEKRRVRLIARIRHDGDEDEIEKSNIATGAYSFSTDAYDGPLDEINRQEELAESPITDHAAVYHHGRSWIKDEPVAPSPKEKKTVIHVKSPKKTKVVEPEEPETKEVRLIARVKPDEPEPEPAVEKTPKKKETSKFGFFKSKITKTTETSTYPVVHEAYTGPLDTTDRSQDLENIPLEHRSSIPAYVPKEYEIYQKAEPIVHEEKRRVRLIARIRHDGDEDEIEKSNIATGAYSFSTDAYDGPLDEINRQEELAESPITDHAAVYHHGRSWIKDEPVAPSPKEKKTVIHVKSPKKTKVVEPEEPETKEVRLIARVKPDEPEPEPAVEKTPKKKETTKFGFFKSKTTKTTETLTYPVVHEAYTGPLDTTDRSQDLENIPLEHRSSIPAYVPKEYEIYQKAEPIVHEEKRRVRLIARIRHDGDEDEIEKSNIATGAYSFSTDAYDGPLDEINRQDELAESPITDHAAVYHHGRSWIKDEPVAPSPKEKRAIIHVKSPKKTKVVEPEEPETKEVRLIARVKPDEPEPEPAVEKTPKKKETTKFGFFKSKTTKTTETSTYPVVHEAYTGPLDTTDRSQDLENIPLEHRSSIPAYVPKEYEIYQKAEPIVHEEKRRVRLIARIRHDGDEDEIEKSNIATGAYSFSTDAYDGPLDEINRQDELAESPITDHAAVYHLGRSWIKDEPVAPSPKEKRAIIHVKSPKKTKVVEPEEPETKEVRLIARVKPDEPEPEPAVEKTPKKKETSKFGFFKSKTTKTTETSTYPVVHEAYTGPLDTTDRSQDLENIPLEHRSSIPAYVPKEYEIYQKAEPIVHEEKRRVRLIARIRHDGDEDEIEKSNIATGAYSFSTDAYDGPLDEINRQDELAESPITDHAAVYHHGRSWIKDEPDIAQRDVSKERTFRLVAHVKPEEKPDDDISSKSRRKDPSVFGLGLFKSRKSAEPESSPDGETYHGPVESTSPIRDLENIPLDQDATITASRESSVTGRIRRIPLFSRNRHEGLEDQVEKSQISIRGYSFPSDKFDGELNELAPNDELIDAPITDFANVYHHGSSWIKDEANAKKKLKTPVEGDRHDVRLIARVLPMKSVKSDDSKKESKSRGRSFWKSSPTETHPRSDRFGGELDTIRRSDELEARNLTDHIGPSTSAAHQRSLIVENTVRFIPSSLQYEPRAARIEGFTDDGQNYVEVRMERRTEILLEPAYFIRDIGSTQNHAYISSASTIFGAGHTHVGALSEDESGLCFSSTPPQMSPPERGFLARLGFKRDKSKKKASKKGKKENDSSETSDSEHDEKREFAVVEFEQDKVSSATTPRRRTAATVTAAPDALNEVEMSISGREPSEIPNTRVVRKETREMAYRLRGRGPSSGFDPNEPESGQPYTTVSRWQETSDLPEQVEVITDENGRQVTRTIKSSQVKHTVQTQSFQNYIVDDEQVPVGVVHVERSREQLTPLKQQGSSSGDGLGVVETQTRTMSYEANNDGHERQLPAWVNEGLGEYVSSKSVTQGNRTIETITYKTEKDGIIETHVEHRVTIHSDGDIDHDAELSQAILEATQMNPDMVVEKIEVRQEQTQ
ncbi:unnamed protein product [Caenorhabditis bovis]|uniref:FERM domain-containing protein n=1 Tax=Caenorhabditis bovis TaxID=2654633 RepID=A0A8S1F8T2_9PELO|nr:unnamed protein product [Caenorhabditis bovis]